MMAAVKAAGSRKKIVLLEKNDRCGNKLLLTGKGRCNITNGCKWDDFQTHIHPDPNFFKNAFYNFSNEDIVSFLNSEGLKTVEERGKRIFPLSGKSGDVRNALVSYIAKFPNVEIKRLTEVLSVSPLPDGGFAVETVSDGDMTDIRVLECRSVIVATGGLSYPLTGSTGDGYRFARELGHKIVPTHPSLTALMPQNYDAGLIGLTLKNVSLSLLIDGKQVQNEFGEITFTEAGLEGALGFRVSRRAVKGLAGGRKVELEIDLKPALTLEQLKIRVERSYEKGTSLNGFLEKFLPIQAIRPFIKMSENVTVRNLSTRLKSWKMKVVEYVGYKRCVVTAGGVDLRNISRKTMGSKIVEGLFFAGEVMNLDADTGGYNLQIAFSTGALAAKSAIRYLNRR